MLVSYDQGTLKTNSQRVFCKARGFTFIELIGVLAIIALLVAVAAPVAINRMDAAARNAEIDSLKTLSESYVQSSLGNRQLPATTDIPQQLATYLVEPTNRVQFNQRKLSRVFLAHPNLNLNGSGLPYVQATRGLTNSPADAKVRVMFISSLSRPLPNIPSSSFENIWSAAERTVPSSLASWGGSGQDLLVERIELAPSFFKVVLLNLEPPTENARYSIDNHAVTNVPSGARVAGYFLKGTVVSFYRDVGTNSSDFVLDYPELIQSDVSFVYQNGRWGRNLSVSDRDEGTFGELVDLFLRQPVPCDSESGATQRSVVDAFYDYLWGYSDWAFGNPTAVPPVPPFSGANTSSSPRYPAYSVVESAQVHMGDSLHSFTRNLIR